MVATLGSSQPPPPRMNAGTMKLQPISLSQVVHQVYMKDAAQNFPDTEIHYPDPIEE